MGIFKILIWLWCSLLSSSGVLFLHGMFYQEGIHFFCYPFYWLTIDNNMQSKKITLVYIWCIIQNQNGLKGKTFGLAVKLLVSHCVPYRCVWHWYLPSALDSSFLLVQTDGREHSSDNSTDWIPHLWLCMRNLSSLFPPYVLAQSPSWQTSEKWTIGWELALSLFSK